MPTKVYVKSDQERGSILSLIRSSVEAQIIQIEIALEMADKRLLPFEKKYNASSEYFIKEMTAEDLKGGDDEYIKWAGEYSLKQRLKKKLEQLQNIEYDYSKIF